MRPPDLIEHIIQVFQRGITTRKLLDVQFIRDIGESFSFNVPLGCSAAKSLGLTPILRVDADGHLIDLLLGLPPLQSGHEGAATVAAQAEQANAEHCLRVAVLCHADLQLQWHHEKPHGVPLGPSVLKHRHLKRKGEFRCSSLSSYVLAS